MADYCCVPQRLLHDLLCFDFFATKAFLHPLTYPCLHFSMVPDPSQAMTVIMDVRAPTPQPFKTAAHAKAALVACVHWIMQLSVVMLNTSTPVNEHAPTPGTKRYVLSVDQAL